MNQEQAIEALKEHVKPDDVLYAQLEHVSKSRMTRFIKVRRIKDDYPYDLTYLASVALGWKLSKRYDAIEVGGCGKDMGFHLISNLSRVLYGDDYAIKHRWL
jgi:hypothetical protein